MPNIFFTQEHLVLAFPLIAFCSTYAFFKFIPLQIGLPALVVVSLLMQARAKLIASRSSDEYVDKTLVKDLTSDQDALIAKQEAKAEKKQRKAQQKLKERLKAERSKGGNNNDAAEDDDDQLIANFAKTKTKKKR